LGRYPESVYRAFKNQSEADAFLRGAIRLGNLKGYPTSTDSGRRDATEGTAHYRHPGVVTAVEFFQDSDESSATTGRGYVDKYVEELNPKFILCCSLPDVSLEHLRRTFGEAPRSV
jgi:hypothetical protein